MPSVPMNILLVEDDPVSREVLRKILESLLGHKVTVAKDGEEAWLLVRDAQVPFDAAFVDIQMPSIDGLQFAELVRKSALEKPPRIILCTGLADRPTVAKAASLGIRHYILKPCSPVTVLEKLRAAMADEGGARPGSSRPASATLFSGSAASAPQAQVAGQASANPPADPSAAPAAEQAPAADAAPAEAAPPAPEASAEAAVGAEAPAATTAPAS